MAITMQELKRKIDDRDAMIQRLRLERQAMLNEVKQAGFKLGINSATTLSYKDFQQLDQRSRLGLHLDAEALDDLWQFLDVRDYPKQLRLNEPGLTALLTVNPQNKAAFVAGWLDGVLSVWQDIQAQLNEVDTSDRN